MADVIVVGGGVAGLCGGLLLARDGHRVRLLERDAAPPPSPPETPWAGWERRGVGQFRQIHFFLPRFRQTLEAELPDVAEAIVAAGALRTNAMATVPPSITGGYRPDDDRFTVLTGRRPVIEAAIAGVAEAEAGLEVRRGTAVLGLLTGGTGRAGVPHVVGVATDAGEELRADLVVDASGRRSPLPAWLAAIGARPPEEEVEDSGFVYYGRHFRSADGSLPALFRGNLQPYESLSILSLPADNGTWGLALTTSSADATLRPARHLDVWERVVKSYPLVAHWLDGEPISGVDVMARIEDRHRRYWVDGAPVATGVVAMADSWACTNPSLGRGASMGLLHAVGLRDVLRSVPVDDALGLQAAWDRLTQEVVEPLYRDTLAFDRHRLAEIEGQIAGVPYETDDPGWVLGRSLRRAAPKDPDLLRGYVAVAGLLERGVDVLSRPGVAERVLQLGRPEPAPGPSCAELVRLVAR